MRIQARLVSPLLLLALGLWACQDQVVNPEATDFELEAAFAKGGKPSKPEPPAPLQTLLGFMPQEAGLWDDPEGRTLDLSADFQLVEKIIGDYGELGFEAENYELAFHWEDELAQTDWGEYEVWCVSRVCTRQICVENDTLNVVKYLQNASDAYEGLVGRISGHNDEWGFDFYTTVGDATDGYMDGHYWIDFCFGNCDGAEEGVYGQEAADAGYPEYVGAEFWRKKSAPIIARRKPLTSTKKNDPWTQESRCGLFPPGPVHRGTSYEILMKPEGG